ncbi:MORN repeat-containing protein 5 [Pectinophora gossypiella]|uniref:MORN repeat-containing protein 5 n=1 Tax=Pectinophora gossypiella TaxID=13191 RepID=UPI00214F0C2A|nr:MORN repeat-containing protein 5 [Pectinophora gossypiella]
MVKKEPLCSLSERTNKAHLVEKEFPTHSSYRGTWTIFGDGNGTFVFPSKAVSYEGSFADGNFHGEGYLTYDNGLILKGQWVKGKMTERKLVFPDGLEFDEVEWNYCCPTDRRYTKEYDFGLEPAGRSYVTSEKPPVTIPPGYYDCGDGFYEPNTCCVYKYDDLTAILRWAH